MHQSIAEIEREFARATSLERHRSASLWRSTAHRKLRREAYRRRKRGSVRFFVLVFTLITTAIAVTALMFTTLYLLLD